MSARRVISAAAGYILVVVLERALSIVTMPITTRLLAPVDFAQLIAINNITSLLNNFVCLFLARALPAVLSAQPNDGARRDAATTIMIGTVLLGAVTLAAMWPLAGWIGQLIGQPGSFPALLRLALVATVVILLGQTMLATARSLERHRLAIVVQSTALVLQTVVVLSLLLLVREGVASLFWAALAGGIVVIAGYLPQLSRWFLGRPSVRHLRRAAQVSSHLLALNLGALVTLNSAGLILNWAGRPEEAAAFNIATGAAALGMLAAYSFDNVWTPYVLHRRADVELPAIARRVFNLHSAGFLLGAALGALFAHEVFVVLVGPGFVGSYALVPPLIGCYALFAFANNFAQGILLDGRPHRFAWIGLATAVVFLAAGMPAALIFGVYGLIAAMALAFAMMTVLMQVASRAALLIGYPWAKQAAIWAFASVLVGMTAYLPLGWTTAGIKIGVLAVLGGMVIATRTVSFDQLRQFVRQGRANEPDFFRKRSRSHISSHAE